MGPVAGVFSIVSALSLILWGSYLFVNRNKSTSPLLLILAAGLILRVFISSDPYLHKWDERYHALVAKNMIDNPTRPVLYKNTLLDYDYKNWTVNHIWVHKPPLPLWLMSGSLSLFGINDFAVRIPSIVLSTLTILLIFLIGKGLFNRNVGFLAAILLCINGLILELTGGRVATDHIDVMFLFFITLSILFALKHAQSQKTYLFILFAVSTGLAILCKWLPALISFPVWLCFLLQFSNRSYKSIIGLSLVYLTIVFVVASLWYIYIFSAFPLESTWENISILKHVTEALDEQTGPFYYYFNKMRINYGELVYLPVIWFTYETIFRRKELKSIGILLWFLIPYIFFSFATTKMQAYTVMSSPAIFLMSSLFFFWLMKYRFGRYKILVTVVLIAMIVLPVRYSVERVKPTKDNEAIISWANELKDLKSKFGNEKVVFFNVKAPIELMFYTNYMAYEATPSKAKIDELISEGWRVVMVNSTEPDNFQKGLVDHVSLSEPLN